VVAIRLDHVDQVIIETLQRDGRRPYSRIAAELGVSEGAIRYRVGRLEQAGILQVVGIADPLQIGFKTMALVGVKVQPGMVPQVCQALSRLPQTSYVAMVTGAFDVFVEVVCRDPADFRELLTSQVHAIEGIREAEAFMILELHKLAYGWGVPGSEPPARLLGSGAKPALSS
jgi:Lrp/AsnC family transcriptional regulator, regulator for asnA, asnC and gidA